MPERRGPSRAPEVFTGFTLIRGGQEADAGQMVAVDPAAGTYEDTSAAGQMGVEELAPWLKERGRSTDAPADGNIRHRATRRPKNRLHWMHVIAGQKIRDKYESARQLKGDQLIHPTSYNTTVPVHGSSFPL